MDNFFYNEHYGPPPAGGDPNDGGEGYEGKMVAAPAIYIMQHPQLITNALNQSPLAAEGQFQLEQEEDMVIWDSGRYTIFLAPENGEYSLTIYGQHPQMVEPLTPEALQIIKTILSHLPQHAGRRRHRRKTKKNMKKRRITKRKLSIH